MGQLIRGIFMKLVLLFFMLTLALISNVNAQSCSSISRTNFSPNEVLRSSDLNTQFNTVYNFANAYDGGCISDATLPLDAADSSWDALKDYLQAGCKVSYSNASTLSISRCYLAVNGAFVAKSSATSVSFGCTNCSSETASTIYYVYAANGSTGTTLTPLILTSAPNEDGYDGSNNKVLARFYNNATGDIDQYSIDQWSVNKFVPQQTGWVNFSPDTANLGTIGAISNRWKRDCGSAVFSVSWTFGTTVASPAYITLPNNFVMDSDFLTNTSGQEQFGQYTTTSSTSSYTDGGQGGAFTHNGSNFDRVYFSYSASSNGVMDLSNGTSIGASGRGLQGTFRVPIEGWSCD